MSVRDVMVQCLLHTEATRTILDVIKTGVDTVEAVLITQSRLVVILLSHTHLQANTGSCIVFFVLNNLSVE